MTAMRAKEMVWMGGTGTGGEERRGEGGSPSSDIGRNTKFGHSVVDIRRMENRTSA
jgi:hypothetical protein